MEDGAKNDVERAELYVPGKDRVLFRPSGRKSLLGLDVLAKFKREASNNTSGFKVPKERVPSIASTMEEEETPEPIVTDEEGSNGVKVARIANRRYRDVARKEDSYAESTFTEGEYGASTPQSHRSSDAMHSEVSERSVITSQSMKSRSSRSDDKDRHFERRDSEHDDGGNRRSGDRYGRDSRERYGKGRERYQQSYGGEYSYRRSRYDGERQTPGE
ncbi:hypothetical protein CRG98_002513 [Punica granatum]|uniref:Uncharacterized protein n=1 Tax=Punica granatum TaxID=22663 RepID=A0A2I0L8N8_PUNGR|nr:hypothetical protein CRG98_002513 [Punica granatum]